MINMVKINKTGNNSDLKKNTPAIQQKSVSEQAPNLVDNLVQRIKGLNHIATIETLNGAVGQSGLSVIKDNEDYGFQNQQITIMESGQASDFIDNISKLKNIDLKVFPVLTEAITGTDGYTTVVIDNGFEEKDLIGIERAKREKLIDQNQINAFHQSMLKLLGQEGLVLKTEFRTDGNDDPVLVFDKKSSSIVALDWQSLDSASPEGENHWKKAINEDFNSR
jgi:hypothetical protein